jgi:hypothetical protein
MYVIGLAMHFVYDTMQGLHQYFAYDIVLKYPIVEGLINY